MYIDYCHILPHVDDKRKNNKKYIIVFNPVAVLQEIGTNTELKNIEGCISLR